MRFLTKIGVTSALIAVVVIAFLSFRTERYQKTNSGIIVKFNPRNALDLKAIKIQVISDKVLRVSATPADSFPSAKSLMVSGVDYPSVKWDVKEVNDHLVLSTSSVKVSVSLSSGEVAFLDTHGQPILEERKGGGKVFSRSGDKTENAFWLQQVFESKSDEAFYGLGQQQTDIINYKGKDVDLIQNNSVAVVPFVVSNKNYGILWDNYSISRFGDVRPYSTLASLPLFSPDGKPGGLTATYAGKKEPHTPFVVRQEKEINYEFLDDIKSIPSGYDMTNGRVTWEGYAEPAETGLYKFSVLSGGYIKIWINGKLVMDKWKICWNPGPTHLSVDFQQGKKYPIRIEWMPDGGQSFLSLKYLSPQPAADQNKLSLSSEAGDQIDYYFMYGKNIDEVIKGYRTVTGKAPIMPSWAMGLWQSRERYKTQAEVLATVDEFRKRGIPLDNIVLDWQYWKEDQWGSQEFDASRFPDPTGMIRDLHEKQHAHFMISVWPKFYEGVENFKLFDKQGWLYKMNVVNRQKDWVGPGYVSTFYDAFNPEARKVFWDIMNKKLFTKGVDAWWMDATEPDILSNSSIEQRKKLMSPALGSSTRYFNGFAIVNAQGIYEGQRSVSPNQRVCILTRSAYAGIQRYAAATWSGDISARWHDLKAQIPAGVNFSMSGIPYWTMDIGGFAVERRFVNAQGEDVEEWRELMTRWFQFGAFSPLFRVHGQFPYREIYNVAPETHTAYKSMVYYDKLRYALMPYTYSMAGMTYHDDYTIMRGLIMDFPSDEKVKDLGDQYMFGSSLLINPVYTYKAITRNVYLPAGTGWFDLYSGKYSEGGQTIVAPAPMEKMPVFVKQGSILPIGPAIQYTGEKPGDPITLYVYAGQDGHFDLYEDEGVNYNYEKGKFSVIGMHYSAANNTLTLADRKGEFAGMVNERKFRVRKVEPGKPAGVDTPGTAGQEVSYTGKALTIKLP